VYGGVGSSCSPIVLWVTSCASSWAHWLSVFCSKLHRTSVHAAPAAHMLQLPAIAKWLVPLLVGVGIGMTINAATVFPRIQIDDTSSSSTLSAPPCTCSSSLSGIFFGDVLSSTMLAISAVLIFDIFRKVLPVAPSAASSQLDHVSSSEAARRRSRRRVTERKLNVPSCHSFQNI
jgi:hypothetical protein